MSTFERAQPGKDHSREPIEEPPPPSGGSAKAFTREDVVLYCFGAALATALIVFFAYQTLHLSSSLSPEKHSERADVWRPNEGMDTSSRAISAFMYAFSHRYEYATHGLIATTARTNAAFIVGVVIALMGCFVVVRGVRESPIRGSFSAGATLNLTRANLTMSSPGLFLASLGVTVILVSLFKTDQPRLEDPEMRIDSGSIPLRHDSGSAVDLGPALKALPMTGGKQ